MSEQLVGGRYTVQRRLAAGGMGEVLLADFVGDDTLSRGLLVVKRALLGVGGDPPAEGQLQMLREEGRLGARLRHENIVETLRVEENGGNPLLVIELLAGRSMAQVLAQAKKQKAMVPIDVALAVLRGAACGLHFAHTLRAADGTALGLVHRDISPANIFVTFDNRVKVIDFGVAKSADSEIRTATGILKGKIGYMSPEQAIGEGTLTAQADVWSLGVFFWEMLVAERLFFSPLPTTTLLEISSRALRLPSSIRPDIPPEVDAICMGMLTRPLETRFASCAAVVRAIDALPAGGGATRAEVGRWLAGRFPDEADAGARDAAMSARLLGVAPPPRGLVDGALDNPIDEDAVTVGAAEPIIAPFAAGRFADADDAATVRLDAQTVDALRRAALAENDAVTKRIAPELLAQARAATRMSGSPSAPLRPSITISPSTGRVPPPPPPSSHLDAPTASLRVPPSSTAASTAASSASSSAASPPPSVPAARPSPPSTDVSATAGETPTPQSPSTEAGPRAALPAAPRPPSGAFAVPAAGSTPARPPSGAFAVPTAAPAPAPGSDPAAAPAALVPAAGSGPAPVRPPSGAFFVPGAGSTASTEVSPGATVAPAARTGSEPSHAPTSSPALPGPRGATSPALSVPPAAASAPSWLAGAVGTFGAFVLVIGIAFSAALPAPRPHLFVFTDEAGFDVVVGDREHAPPGVAVRDLDLATPVSLRRAGSSAATVVSTAELRDRLEESGVWARSLVPATARARGASLVPLAIIGLGLLALAWAIPTFVVRGRAEGALRIGLAVAVLVVVGSVLQNGGLGWAGRSVTSSAPRLEWR
jgi:serine/threonine-protein kinase